MTSHTTYGGSRLPERLLFSDCLPNCFIAGGAVLSTVTRKEIADYDVYPKTHKAAVDAVMSLLENNCFVINISDRAITLKCNDEVNDKGERIIVQVMYYDEFPTADHIFKHFDFTVCMAAYDCDTHQYHFHQDFAMDVAQKALRFNPGTKFPLNSLLRVNKYIAKGFFISKYEHIRMALTIAERAKIESWDDLEHAIGGTYGRQVRLLPRDRHDTVVGPLAEHAVRNEQGISTVPFSFDLAMEHMAWLADQGSTQWLERDQEYDYSNFQEMHFKLLINKGQIFYFENKAGKRFIVDFVDDKIDPNSILDMDSFFDSPVAAFFDKDRLVNIDPVGVMRVDGYKVVYPGEKEGEYRPQFYGSTSMRYRVGEVATTSNPLGIFIYPTNDRRSTDKRLVTLNVSFKLADLINIKPHLSKPYEIQAREIRVESIHVPLEEAKQTASKQTMDEDKEYGSDEL
jgi:hypothetical protein